VSGDGVEAISELVDMLRASRILPVVRASTGEKARETCEELYAAGLRIIELTTTIPSWDQVLIELAGDRSDLVIGVGTVVTSGDAGRAIDRGARFLVSPCQAEEVRAVSSATGVPFIEGGLTPSEVLSSARHGMAKLFPAHVGGVAFLRDILTVSPHALIVPSGGIRLTDAPAWLDAGALAVGVGGDLTAGGDLRQRLRASSVGGVADE
jgi:2-dehydro-3-deoxyphosphogluconate aldolase/(4S)-4-hydroxy-2-oxoglutarate aldolase